MSPLLETIKLKDGKLYNLEFHSKRFNKARKELFGVQSNLNLRNFIKVPKKNILGLFRCRITYTKEILNVEFIQHNYREVKSLKLIEDNSIDYQFKYSDRSHLQLLFKQRGECDDILIVKNGCISDSLTANPIFFDGEKWWTPESVLLPGTQREKLLCEGKIYKCRITPSDLHKYKKVGLINAMQDMDHMPIVLVEDIW